MDRAPFVLGVSLVVAGALWGCTDDTTFTKEEREVLLSFKLPSEPPANPSNKYADDRRAAVLGKKIFFDKRFSGALSAANDGVSGGSLGPAGATEKVACFDCHQLDQGGADRRSRTPTSLGANFGLRNAPTVINAAHWDVATGGWQLWDGRKDSLWSLALGPMEGPNEHNGTRLQYAHLVYNKYRAEYEAIFGPMPPLSDTDRFPLSGKPGQPAYDAMAMEDKAAITKFYSNLGKALEAYERLLVSGRFEKSPFDKALEKLEQDDLAGVLDVMSPAAVRGAKLFVGKAACNECHSGAMFTDFRFHNIGCPQQGQNVPTVDLGRRTVATPMGQVSIATFVMNDPMNRNGAFSDFKDDSHIVKLLDEEAKEAERSMAGEPNRLLGAFRTPSLRNIEKTQPYMHNGVYQNLWDVVAHYNFGGGTGSFSGTKEAAIAPLLLTDQEMDDLVEFLRALSDGAALPVPEFPEGLIAAPTLPQ